jgi:hypothetical protein
MSTPAAMIVGMRTDGANIDQVRVACPYCGGRHSHRWYGETDGYRQPSCGALATYRISIDTRTRIDAMRTAFPAPDGVVGLVPLHIGYAYERDGEHDIVGVVLDTTLGGFAMWLELDNALQLAAQLVAIAENRDRLATAYTAREIQAGSA